MKERKVVLFISMSVDGFIATEDDDLSWLSMVEREGEDYGYSHIIDRTDTYIVGRRTYYVVMNLTGGKFPYADSMDCYIMTRTPRDKDGRITFYTGEIEALIADLKKREGKDIYCDGGGQVVKLLMEKNLIDEYVISIIPTMLGSGKRLFSSGVSPVKLKSKGVNHYESGVVQLHYLKE